MSDPTNSYLVKPPTSVSTNTVSTTSTAAVAVGITGWVTFKFEGDNSGDRSRIIFGSSSVAAADANDYPLTHGIAEPFYFAGGNGITHFRIIGIAVDGTGDGDVYWYSS